MRLADKLILQIIKKEFVQFSRALLSGISSKLRDTPQCNFMISRSLKLPLINSLQTKEGPPPFWIVNDHSPFWLWSDVVVLQSNSRPPFLPPSSIISQQKTWILDVCVSCSKYLPSEIGGGFSAQLCSAQLCMCRSRDFELKTPPF